MNKKQVQEKIHAAVAAYLKREGEAELDHLIEVQLNTHLNGLDFKDKITKLVDRAFEEKMRDLDYSLDYSNKYRSIAQSKIKAWTEEMLKKYEHEIEQAAKGKLESHIRYALSRELGE